MIPPFSARRLPDGRLEVPMRAYDPATGTIGDGLVILAPGDDQYEHWESIIRKDSPHDRPDIGPSS